MHRKHTSLAIVTGGILALGGGLIGCETQDPVDPGMHQEPGVTPQEPAPQQPAQPQQPTQPQPEQD